MTTFQDPQPQSRRAARQSERGEQQNPADFGQFPSPRQATDSQSPSQQGAPAPEQNAEPQNPQAPSPDPQNAQSDPQQSQATSGRRARQAPQQGLYDLPAAEPLEYMTQGQSDPAQPATAQPTDARSADSLQTGQLPEPDVAPYRVRDFSPEGGARPATGRRAAPATPATPEHPQSFEQPDSSDQMPDHAHQQTDQWQAPQQTPQPAQPSQWGSPDQGVGSAPSDLDYRTLAGPTGAPYMAPPPADAQPESQQYLTTPPAPSQQYLTTPPAPSQQYLTTPPAPTQHSIDQEPTPPPRPSDHVTSPPQADASAGENTHSVAASQQPVEHQTLSRRELRQRQAQADAALLGTPAAAPTDGSTAPGMSSEEAPFDQQPHLTTPPPSTVTTPPQAQAPTLATMPPPQGFGTTPPSAAQVTAPQFPAQATTPPFSAQATTPPFSAQATTPPSPAQATTPPFSAQATTPPFPAQATTPPPSAQATTPPFPAASITPPPLEQPQSPAAPTALSNAMAEFEALTKANSLAPPMANQRVADPSAVGPMFIEPAIASAPPSAPASTESSSPRTGSYVPPTGHWSRQRDLDDQTQPWENTITREVGGGNVATTTSALVLPEIPRATHFSSALDSTGEVLLTGSIDLPRSLSSIGGDSRAYDDPQVDYMFDTQDAEFTGTDSSPVSAIRAVSTHTSARGVIHATKPHGNRMLVVVFVATAALAVTVVGVLVAALVFNVF